MIYTEYFENVTLSPKRFRAFYLCCAALAKATQGEGFANRYNYVLFAGVCLIHFLILQLPPLDIEIQQKSI